MTIRVLHIIGSLGLGGAQVVLRHIAENIDSTKIETFIYPLRQDEILMPIKGNVIEHAYFNYDPRKFFAILRLCRKYKIDIIHAHLDKPILGSLLASYFCKVHVIVHEHSPIFLKSWKNAIYRIILRLLQSRASVFIAVSGAVKRQLIKAKIAPQKIRVVHNSIDFDEFNPNRTHRERLRKLLDIATDDIVLGFVGRLSDVKGVDLLVEAMDPLLKKSSQYLLVICGDGPLLQSLQAATQRLKISNRVRFLGFRDDIAEIINAFDIAVVPSRQEAFGIATLEFMRTKVPLVCSAVEGLAEIVTDDVTALVPAENTPQQICSCIERLTEDEQLRKKLVDNAYEFCEKFSVKEYVKSIQQIYEEALHK